MGFINQLIGGPTLKCKWYNEPLLQSLGGMIQVAPSKRGGISDRPAKTVPRTAWQNLFSHRLVGGIPTILKNMSQWEGLSHILWKIIQIFDTTNQ